jgi:hypothetical protein
MSVNNVVQTTIEEFAKESGCVKKSGSWFLRSEETIFVLNLQKSQYGLQCFVNVAVWLRALGDIDAPRENKCQIRTRLTRLVPADLEQRLTQLLDLDKEMDEQARRAELRGVLDEHLFPLMQASGSLDGLRSVEGQRLLKKSLVNGAGHKLLGAGV